MVISKTKAYQQEVLLRLELIITEKIHSLNGKAVSYEDVIELDILHTISEQFNTIFDLTSDDVPFEVLTPWMVLNTYKQLLKLYIQQSKLNDDEYLKVLDRMAGSLLIGLFTTH